MEKRKEKAKESIQAVLPILFIVLLLSFTVAPVSASILLEFMIGAMFVIIGMLFFSMGAEMSMSPMGERVGGSMLKTKKLWVILLLGFFLGVIITISEPDLQVLAAQVPSVPNMVLILSVAAGVGAFLVVALLRILFGIALAPLLVVFYGVIFLIARFVPDNFLAVAFDSGGVTTGPMTVPFIMALGVGISAIRNDKHAENDSFGLVALCSIGPVLAVLLLGLVYPAQGSYVAAGVPEAFNSVELGRLFLSEIPYYLKEIAGSLLPIVFFFGIFQLVSIQLHKKTLIKICVGLLYTYVGLVLFLTCNRYGITAVSVDFSPGRNGDRIFHCQGRAGRLCPDETGRRTDRWGYFRKSDADQPFGWCGCFGRAFHAAGAYRNSDYVFFNSGLCHCTVSDVICSENLYRDCV